MNDYHHLTSEDELFRRWLEWREQHPKQSDLTLDEWWAQRVELGLHLHTNPAFTITNYRFRTVNADTAGANDAFDGSDPAINTDVTLTGGSGNVTIRYRCEIDETDGGSENNAQYTLQFSHNSAAYANIGTSTSPIRLIDNTAYSNQTATTNLISGSSRSFLAGDAMDTTANSDNTSFSGNQHTEMDWSLECVDADLSDGDDIQFRVTSNKTAPTQLSPDPQINWEVTVAATVYPPFPRRQLTTVRM